MNIEDNIEDLVRRLAKRGSTRFPRPAMFMTGFEGTVGYVVNEHAAFSRLYMFQYSDGYQPQVILFACSSAWAELAAHNLARSYRPEGVS